MKFHRSVGTLGIIGLSLVLVACTSPVPEALPQAVVETIAVPESMEQHQPYVTIGGAALSATEKLPFAFGGSAAEPGKAAAPAVWVSDDGKDWRRTVVDSDVTGSFAGTLAGSDSIAALGGTEWKDRALTSRLWVSKDREVWKSVKLPKEFAEQFRISVLTVIDSRILVIGQAADGSVSGLSVVGSKVLPLSLPATAKKEFLSPTAIAGNKDQLVLVAMPGPEGDNVPTVAYSSSNAGKSWSSSPVEIADSTSSVAGLVWTGEEFVATGSGPQNDTPGAASRARAWSSPDGETWSVENIPDPPNEGASYLPEAASMWFGAPLARDGRVTVIASNENSAASLFYERQQDGTWSFGGVTNNNEASGEGGVAIPAASGSTVAVLGASGYLRTGVFSQGAYVDGTTISSREFPDRISEFLPSADGTLIVLSQLIYTVDDETGWRNSRRSNLAEYTRGTNAKLVEWDPAAAGELINVTKASDKSGAELVVGSEFPAGSSTILGRGFFRESSSAEWQALTGFDTSGATGFNRILRTQDGWMLGGAYRTSSNAGTPSHAGVWTSLDGVNWVVGQGEFGSGRLESSISDACLLPDGTPIAVGYTEKSTGSFRMTAWSPAGDSWAVTDLGKVAEREGFASSCASDSDGVIISGTLSGRSVILHTSDGTTWKKVFTADRGIDLDNPVAVSGGFVAAGRWSNDTTTGPVVWLSRDGTSWKPIAVPSLNTWSSTKVTAEGKDILVGMSYTSGNPLIVIRDIKKVINDTVGK